MIFAWTIPIPVLTAVRSGTDNVLHWDTEHEKVQGYRIERKVDAGAWTVLTTKAPGQHDHTDANVTTAGTYRYRVVAYRGMKEGISNESDPIVVSGGGGGDPLSLPLVQASDWYAMTSYLGSILKPFEDANQSFQYGKGLWVYDGGMYMSGNSGIGKGPGRMSLPAIGGTGGLQIGHNDAIMQLPASDPSPQWVNGCFVYNDQLYTSMIRQYDGTLTAGGIVVCDLDLTDVGGFTQGVSNRGAYERGMHGVIIGIPAIWQSLLGGPCAMLGAQASLIQNCCNGYGFSVFDPADIPRAGGTFGVDTLLWYPHVSGSPGNYPSLQRFDGVNEPWYNWRSTCTVTAIFPENSRSLLYIAAHGYGVTGGVPECRPGSSVHSGPYRLQVVGYDLADLVDVKNGVITYPYDPEPYGVWTVTEGSDNGPMSTCVNVQSMGTGTFDVAAGRLYVHESNARTIHVWSVG